MLSRANSDAGTRLRHAKSSSSVSHRSRGIPIPVVDPRHAEWAAVEAYRRAHEHQDSIHQARQSVTQNKRQTRAAQRSEGSHFEESRNGNRIGTAKPKDLSRTSSLKRPDPGTKVLAKTPSADFEGTIVTRPRRVVNTISTTQPGAARISTNHASTTDSDRVRKAKSAYYESSCTDGDTLDLKKTRRATYYPDTPYRTAIESRGSDSGDPTASTMAESRKPTAREMQTDDSIKVAAWDAYLQDFHQRKLNVRKSFIAPLKKILTKESTPTTEVKFDQSTPPYNFALESDDVFSPSPVPPVANTEPLQLPKPRKTRTVSDTLKSKFHRLISRSKRTPSAMPVQHIESQNLHFGPGAAVYGSEWPLSSQYKLMPPPPVPPQPNLGETRQSSSGSSQSGGDAGTMKSRVSSWTNSTSTGTGTNRASYQAAHLCPIDERGVGSPAKEQSIVNSKPGHGSFFGRALRMPLRRPSKTDLGRSSEDSQRLYNALRKQMQGSESGISNTIDTSINDDVVATETVVKEYLPPRCAASDQDNTEDTGILPGHSIKVIQSGSSEASESAVQPEQVLRVRPTNITRKTSWFSNARRSLPSQNISKPPSSQNMMHWPTQSVLQDDPEPITRAVRPSQEQIAARLDKSQNRWQSPLNDESPVQSRALRYDAQEDNPYKLRSISSTPQVDYLPVAVHHGEAEVGISAAQAPRTILPILNEREQVISPSVYSRASECRSTTPNDVHAEHGTFITVTGREVKRYSLDSPAKSIRDDNFVAKPSHEWKAWLNTELRDFSATPGADELRLDEQGVHNAVLSHNPLVVPVRSGHVRQPVESFNSGEVPSDSHEDLSSEPPINFFKTRRPKLTTHPSSIMNERYPLVGTARTSSSERGSHAGYRAELAKRRTLSGTKALSAVKRPSGTSSSAIQRDTDEETFAASNPINARPRIRERHSAAILGATRKRPSTAVPDMPLSTGGRASTSTKPKSALDLRAVYRNTNSPDPSSINIRRKPISAVLQDDETLRKISEGPYGRVISSNKENDVPVNDSSLCVASKLAYEMESSASPQPADVWHSSRATLTLPAAGLSSGRSKGSPGQRMVDDWLSMRKSTSGQASAIGAESSPAFI